MDWIYAPWPWYVIGPSLAVVMFLLVWFGKNFGMSANLRTLCSSAGAGKFADFFQFDWKSQKWNLMVLIGAILGGVTSANFLMPDTVELSPEITKDLVELGIENPGSSLVPNEIFGNESMGGKQLAFLVIGGLLVGFGARYAGGCTSGHAISGLSNLQWPSMIAVIGFFIGGLIMTWALLPLIV